MGKIDMIGLHASPTIQDLFNIVPEGDGSHIIDDDDAFNPPSAPLGPDDIDQLISCRDVPWRGNYRSIWQYTGDGQDALFTLLQGLLLPPTPVAEDLPDKIEAPPMEFKVELFGFTMLEGWKLLNGADKPTPELFEWEESTTVGTLQYQGISVLEHKTLFNRSGMPLVKQIFAAKAFRENVTRFCRLKICEEDEEEDPDYLYAPSPY